MKTRFSHEFILGQIYYVARENTQSSWIRARLIQIIPPSGHNSTTSTMYKVVELKQQRERVLIGKNLAYMSHSKVRLPVGTRVISLFKELNNLGEKKTRHDPYYAGIVAEQPFVGNKWR